MTQAAELGEGRGEGGSSPCAPLPRGKNAGQRALLVAGALARHPAALCMAASSNSYSAGCLATRAGLTSYCTTGRQGGVKASIGRLPGDRRMVSRGHLRI